GGNLTVWRGSNKNESPSRANFLVRNRVGFKLKHYSLFRKLNSIVILLYSAERDSLSPRGIDASRFSSAAGPRATRTHLSRCGTRQLRIGGTPRPSRLHRAHYQAGK